MVADSPETARRMKMMFADGKYRKKPVVIDAFQFEGVDDLGGFGCPAWMVGAMALGVRELGGAGMLKKDLLIHSMEGIMTAKPGDWIVRGIQGELYPVKPDIFQATYEPA